MEIQITFSDFFFEKRTVRHYNLKITKENKYRKAKREIIMKKKQVTATVFAAIIAASAVFTVSTGNVTVQAKAKEEDKTVLRIAAQPYPLYSSVWVAHELGYLDEELNAVNAEYTWTEFQSGPLVNEAVAAGEADLGFMADLPAIIAKSTGQEIEIVSNVAYGGKGVAVLVSPDSDIKSVADLKGKKVAYATGSYAQHLLALLLDQEGMSLKDVESVNLGAGDQPSALANGQVDAIVIWEQYISKLTTDGTAKVLADGTGIKRGNMINYAVSSYAEEHPDVIEAYIKALNKADDYIKEKPEEAAKLVADDFGVEEDIMEKILSNLTFTTELTTDDIDEIKKVKDFSLESGIIGNDVDIDSFINTEYLDAAAK